MHAVEAEDAVGPSRQSVLNQTLENVEIICIDGASSDATLSVNLSRAKKGSRILSCRLASREPEAAERLGLDLARGKVCVFLGSRKAFRSRTVLLELCAEGALRRERDRKLFFRG